MFSWDLGMYLSCFVFVWLFAWLIFETYSVYAAPLEVKEETCCTISGSEIANMNNYIEFLFYLIWNLEWKLEKFTYKKNVFNLRTQNIGGYKLRTLLAMGKS